MLRTPRSLTRSYTPLPYPTLFRPSLALGDERGCAGASGSPIGIDRQVERATRPGSCQRARGTAAKRAAAADRLHDDAIGLIARRVDSRADGDVHRAAATRALWHRSSRKKIGRAHV